MATTTTTPAAQWPTFECMRARAETCDPAIREVLRTAEHFLPDFGPLAPADRVCIAAAMMLEASPQATAQIGGITRDDGNPGPFPLNVATILDMLRDHERGNLLDACTAELLDRTEAHARRLLALVLGTRAAIATLKAGPRSPMKVAP